MKLRGKAVPYHAAVYALALAWIVLAAVWMIFSLGGHLSHGVLPGWIDTLHKSALPPTRLLHVLALAYLLVHSPLWTPLTRIANADPIVTRMGRNSLPVFVAGSLMSMVGYIVLVQTGPDIGVELLLTTAGLTVMWLTAVVSEIGAVEVVTQSIEGVRALAASRDAHLDEQPITTSRTDKRG